MSWTLTTLSGASFKAGVNRDTSLSGTDFDEISEMSPALQVKQLADIAVAIYCDVAMRSCLLKVL